MRPAPSLVIGDTLDPRAFGPLVRADIARFAGAGGDFNPLHVDDEAARASGFPSVIAMGQFQAGVVAGALSDWVGVEHVLRYEVRFASPWSPGELLEVTGEVTRVENGTASIDLVGRVGDRTVISASATVAAATS